MMHTAYLIPNTLEIMLNIAPLRLQLKRIAAINTCRLRLSSNFKAGDLTEHIATLTDLKTEVKSLEIQTDVVPVT